MTWGKAPGPLRRRAARQPDLAQCLSQACRGGVTPPLRCVKELDVGRTAVRPYERSDLRARLVGALFSLTSAAWDHGWLQVAVEAV